MEKAFYTVAEIIEITGLGRTKVYEEINHGRLQAKKCGARTLISADSVSTWSERLKPFPRGGVEKDE